MNLPARLAATHSPHPRPSHVKVRMSPLPPCKLPLLGFYCFGFCCSHFTSGYNFHFSVWVAGEAERQREGGVQQQGRGSPSSGLGYLPCTLSPAPTPPFVPTMVSGPVANPSSPARVPVHKGHLLANSSGTYSLLCLCGPGQKLHCILGSVFACTMSSSSYPSSTISATFVVLM